MYAIIENGGKQYKAIEGEYIEIDLLPEEVGKKKTFDKVLLLSAENKIEVGTPFLNGISVDTTILSHFKGPKLIVFKYRAKQRYRVKTGHRQRYTRVLVDSIAFLGKSAVTKKSDSESKEDKPKAAKKTVSKKKPAATVKPAAKKTTATKSAAKKTTAAKKPAASTKKTTAAKKATTSTKKSSSADKK